MYRQELETEQVERGLYSASSSDEENDLLPHCRQGYEESSSLEEDFLDTSAVHVGYSNVCDFD